VPAAIIHDPDPETYTQSLIAGGGSLPTFNSPDVDTVDVWPIVPLDPVDFTIRNLSTEASANQTRVDVSWSPWGIGMPRSLLGTVVADLPRAGFPGSEQKFSLPLTSSAKAAGIYGAFVQIYHPYDSNTRNNSGEQTLNGFTTKSSGRAKDFPLPVRNPSFTTQTINFVVGPPTVASWVTLTPSTLTLGPGVQGSATIHIAIPGAVPVSPPGTEISFIVDIMAVMGGAYLGGVSIAILIDA
jgi:hypothetical protein